MCKIVKFDKNYKSDKNVSYLVIVGTTCSHVNSRLIAIGMVRGALDGIEKDYKPFLRLYEISTNLDGSNEHLECLYSNANPIDLNSLLVN